MDKKIQTIRVRVPHGMKDTYTQMAEDRGEHISVIVREALSHYLTLSARARARLAIEHSRVAFLEQDGR
jgi:predicted DNA-binding protein